MVHTREWAIRDAEAEPSARTDRDRPPRPAVDRSQAHAGRRGAPAKAPLCERGPANSADAPTKTRLLRLEVELCSERTVGAEMSLVEKSPAAVEVIDASYFASLLNSNHPAVAGFPRGAQVCSASATASLPQVVRHIVTLGSQPRDREAPCIARAGHLG